ncbi:MAG: hypothetical protein ABI960_07195 [Candidatus Eisenbacteria bacterium]
MQTLDWCHAGVERLHARFESLRGRPGARGGTARLATFACLAGIVGGASIAPAPAFAEPAFGDSNWVAPQATLAAGNPADPGPRVAKRDDEPLGETILRTPFRVAFLPLRLIARGSEKLAGFAGSRGGPSSSRPKPGWKLEPVVSTDPGGGFRLTRRLSATGASKVFLTTQYAWNDRRKAKLTYRSGEDDAWRGVHAEGAYSFRPNTTFYGIGNESDRGMKSIWLDEEAKVDASAHFGRPVQHELRLLAGYSSISARSGFNAASGVERLEENFTPAEVPFLLRGSRVYSFGVAAEVATLDNVRTPSRGVAARLGAQQFKAADTSDLDYRRYHLEARAYVPVFAERRVLALRILHDWVDPASGSPAIPYYRLPESAEALRFNGYSSHRFVDRHLVLAQLEYRWWLSNKIYALVNANLGEVASTARRLRYADLHEAYGLGLRYGYSDRIAGRVDAAKGSEGVVLNLSIEETF